jgi:uncharacterized membrane protein
MTSNARIQSISWHALKANGLVTFALVVLHGVLSAILGNFGFGLGSLLLSGALSYGFSRTMVQVYRGQTPAINTYFDGFQRFVDTLICTLLVGAIVVVGMVFLFIPGIIAALGLSQVFFVLQDRDDLDAIGAVKESWRLVWTNGNMLKVLGMAFRTLFVLLLGALAFGVGLFVAIPLISVMGAGLYEEIKRADRLGGGDVHFT